MKTWESSDHLTCTKRYSFTLNQHQLPPPTSPPLLKFSCIPTQRNSVVRNSLHRLSTVFFSGSLADFIRS
ncbi:hypothetical protein FOVSG1_012723 [Fusarium oxysporum f. sp. vasinfectum]